MSNLQIDNFKFKTGTYGNNSLAVDIIEDGELYGCLSTNLVREEIIEGCIFILDSGIHRSIAEELTTRGYIEPLGEYAQSGFNKYQRYKLHSSFFELAQPY